VITFGGVKSMHTIPIEPCILSKICINSPEWKGREGNERGTRSPSILGIWVGAFLGHMSIRSVGLGRLPRWLKGPVVESSQTKPPSFGSREAGIFQRCPPPKR